MTTDEKRDGLPRYLIIALILLPFLVWIGREIFTGQLIGYFRALDFADMVILTPIYIAVLLYLWTHLQRHEAGAALLIAFGVFGMLFIFGQGLHVAGNSINTFMTEVRDYKAITPPDAYALIFFMDEVLSHLVLFGAMIGILAVWLIFDVVVGAPALLPQNRLFLLAAGLMFGGVLAYALIEARSAYVIVALAGVLGGIWLVLWRRSGLGFRDFLQDRPFRTFAVVLVVGTVLVMGVWALIFGGFPQPSDVGL